MTKCSGCGALLQSEDRKKLGFIPEEKKDATFCERCFRIHHYNDLQLVELSKNEEVLEVVNKEKKFVFFLAPLFTIDKEVMDTYHRIECPKCLLISKVDLLPKSLSYEKIKNWLKEVYDVSDVLFFSAVKNYNVKSLLKVLEETNSRSAYVLGYTNAGKSTLLNRLTNEEKITTSIVPNTTLDFISIPLEGGYFLIDTPGFSYKTILYSMDNLKVIKKLNGKNRIRPLIYPLKMGASIVIEDLIRIENKSPSSRLVFYVPNALEIKKVYEKNKMMKDKKCVSVFLERNEDLVLKGIGFVTSKSSVQLQVYVEKEEVVEKRKSFFER